MAGKSGAGKASAGSRVVTALVGAGAAFAARKVLFFGWKKVTGKEPPEHPEDPQVGLGEALIEFRRTADYAHAAAAAAEGHLSDSRERDAGVGQGPACQK